MQKKLNDKERRRYKRKIHIRKRIHGTSERPRLSVFKSNKNLFVQVIDDDTANTLLSISTLEKAFLADKLNVATGSKVGEEMGKRLKDKNISSIVFDRNGYLYHGVVKAVADGVRKAGIEF
ncbi:MAG: 50S ribosomal protein L18 [Spirochaetaceae bacterium]|nr:50S ribosomal protein L18 [Spirochaetaceae bacterium]